jgi:hypothetical protein
MKHHSTNHPEIDRTACKRKLRVPSGFAVALLALALSGCNDHAAAPITRAAIVRTEIVQPRDRQASVTLTGEIQARFRPTLSFRVSGRCLHVMSMSAPRPAGEVLPARSSGRADVDAATAAVLAANLSCAWPRRPSSGAADRSGHDADGLRSGAGRLRTAEGAPKQQRELTSKDALGYTACARKRQAWSPRAI